MKLNAATLLAAKEHGLNRAQMEEYVNNGGGMSDELREKCKTCLLVGRMQDDMSDAEYEKHYDAAEPSI